MRDALSGGAGQSTDEIRAQIEGAPRAARTHPASLLQRGLLTEIGFSPQDPNRRYFKAMRD